MSIGIANSYNNYARSYTNTVNNSEKTSKAEQSNSTTKTASDELSYLSNKYSNCSFVVANYTKGMQYGSNSTTNIAISPQFLSKMASDTELEKEYEGYIVDLQRLDKEFVQQQAARGCRVVDQGWAIDKNGDISGWAIVSKDPNAKSHLQIMSENADKIRKQGEENKKAKAEIQQKRDASKAEKAELQQKLEQKHKEKFSDKFKGITVMTVNNKKVAGTNLNRKV